MQTHTLPLRRAVRPHMHSSSSHQTSSAALNSRRSRCDRFRVSAKLASRVEERVQQTASTPKVNPAKPVLTVQPAPSTAASPAAPKPSPLTAPPTKPTWVLPTEVLAFVLGGGQGADMYPLTRQRAEPAVPILGSYRLIDIPVSNCLNSNVNKVYVLTQFNSRPLNRHLAEAYRFVNCMHMGHEGAFVEPLNATLTSSKNGNEDWFSGTADAVRQYLKCINDPRNDEVQDVMVLCGDQIYRMDYSEILNNHRRSNADVTLACLPCSTACASQFGVLELDETLQVQAFHEKPGADKLSALKTPQHLLGVAGKDASEKPHAANMGVYVFKKDVLIDLLTNKYPQAVDFSRDILAPAASSLNIRAYPFTGYWQDVGTLASYYETSMALVKDHNDSAALQLYHQYFPIYTSAKVLPPIKLRNADIQSSMIGHGCVIGSATIKSSILGDSTRVGDNCWIEETITFGADFMELPENAYGDVIIGIGSDSKIRKAIIDKNACIGRGVEIVNAAGIREADREADGFCIRDGIVCILKDAVIPDGTRI